MVMLLLLIAGFAILDFVLIAIGKKSVGYIGIALLCIIPAWFGFMAYLERRPDDPRYPTDDIREEVITLLEKRRK